MRQLIEDLISAMEYHVEQTRPIHSTTVALQAARDALKSLPAQEPVACAAPMACSGADKCVFRAQRQPVGWWDKATGNYSRVGRVGWAPVYAEPASKPWVGLEPNDFTGVIKGDAFEAGAYWANNILRAKNA